MEFKTDVRVRFHVHVETSSYVGGSSPMGCQIAHGIVDFGVKNALKRTTTTPLPPPKSTASRLTTVKKNPVGDTHVRWRQERTFIITVEETLNQVGSTRTHTKFYFRIYSPRCTPKVGTAGKDILLIGALWHVVRENKDCRLRHSLRFSGFAQWLCCTRRHWEQIFLR